VVGGSGGSRIFPAVFQAIVNVDWGLDASTAVEFGRVHDQLFPPIVEVDNVLPAELVQGLRIRGHNVTRTYSCLIYLLLLRSTDI
jgi:gamma-glutamyltranspeptidase / glutathione hydrolase / leukotriene-C4 hydrolase